MERRGTVVQVGRRVVLNVHEGGRFHVYRADDSSSIIEVTGGEVGFRLFHGVAAHRLLVSAGGMTVEAVGTVFTVGLDGGPSVAVHQGKVAARVGEEEFLVTQGFELHAASGRLLANSEQDPILESWDLTIESQSREPSAAASSAVKTGRTPDAATARTKIESEPDERSESASGLADAGRRLAVDLWRSARLLRAQARYLEAISALEELASMEDSTWSPLALVEKARIERSALSDPKAALRSAGEFMRRHPSHQLAPEARQLRCDAARAVGITEQDCL
ncbi:MAG: FecR domain-containing protein [Myxococcales bacterium]|nr:FecR domain-containing protein [Myxococcales bacterium]